MKKYLILTYGCQMNVHESEKIRGMLESLGFAETDKKEEADVVVFNTCCIRESAESKIMGHIGSFKPIKKDKKDMIIAVGGCMSEQPAVAEKLMKKFPFVDIVFGTANLHRFKELLEKRIKTMKRVKEIGYEDVVNEDDLFVRDDKENAYVNIIYGCNNFCSYCIVPYVRGRERSRKPENIIKEVKSLVKEGYKSITLLGQNVNSYGKDLENKTTFPELLRQICKIDGGFEIHFMSSHPKDFTDELISVIATEDKVSKDIHLPLQSGSDKILKLMNRNYTAKKYYSIIEKLKKSVPNCTITTDIIVGFPGESKHDFNQTVKMIKKVKYDSLFAFMYSRRKGTVADKMPNQVPNEIKHKRVNYILALEKKIQKQKEKAKGRK